MIADAVGKVRLDLGSPPFMIASLCCVQVLVCEALAATVQTVI